MTQIVEKTQKACDERKRTPTHGKARIRQSCHQLKVDVHRPPTTLISRDSEKICRL